MKSAQSITESYPVVYFTGDAVGGGWYFRGAGDEVVFGPFKRRDEAVTFALKKLSGEPEPVAAKAQRKKAA